jgi:glucose-1-phosphate thymidylyltransferase
MKGVILAGGRGQRLWPLTRGVNKHLLPVGDRPMIAHGLQTLAAAGIRDLLIVTGAEHLADFRRVLGPGYRYAAQPRPAGVADALRHAEHFADGEPIAVLLGDNLFGGPLRLKPFTTGACIFLKRVRDAQHFGIAEFRGRQLTRIVEKPRRSRSALAVVGLYLFDAQVFDIIRQLRPSRRGELEIADVLNAYLTRGQLQHQTLPGWWCDAGNSLAALFAAARRVGARP